jgi:glycosyltransferase involved in cell wall biosynthesis
MLTRDPCAKCANVNHCRDGVCKWQNWRSAAVMKFLLPQGQSCADGVGAMRVLHFLGIGLIPKRPMIDASGGTERVALEIARIQARRGMDVTVASMASASWKGTWEGVKLRHLRPYSWAKIGYRGNVKDFRLQLSLAKYIRLGRFDIIHLHEHRWTGFFENKPKVMHFHNDPVDGRSGEAAIQYWRELGKAGAQIAVSSFVGRRLHLTHQHAGASAPSSSIVVNQNGVDADILSSEQRCEARVRIRRELGLKDTDVIFMFAGAIRPQKGVIQLAQAFAKLAKEHDNAFLVIAGGSKLWINPPPNDTAEHEVRTILADATTRGQVSILGIVSPALLPSYYAAADVFVLPSMFQETFGLVILEAFAAGIPVIGARSGGVPELVLDDHTGLLVDQGDVDGLRDAMARLLLDGALRKRLGAAGRQTAVKMPWENTVDRLEQTYQSVLA